MFVTALSQIRKNSSSNDWTILRDRLGSTIGAIDGGLPASGSTNARTYDPFGAARNADMSARTHGTMNLADTVHGFTKHDEADDVWLIQTGGRIYDQNLGRFLQVDPVIGNPGDSRSINPYSYVVTIHLVALIQQGMNNVLDRVLITIVAKVRLSVPFKLVAKVSRKRMKQFLPDLVLRSEA